MTYVCQLAQRSQKLFVLSCLSGCDVVSAFRGKGKKRAWQTWNVCPESTAVFIKLSQFPTMINDEDQRIHETFVTTMYDRSS